MTITKTPSRGRPPLFKKAMTGTSFALTAEQKAAIELEAARREVTRSQVLRDLIAEHLLITK